MALRPATPTAPSADHLRTPTFDQEIHNDLVECVGCSIFPIYRARDN